MTQAFLAPALISFTSRTTRPHPPFTSKRPSRPSLPFRVPRACAPAPTDATADPADTPIIPEAKLPEVLAGTMLADEPLALAYISSRDGFDNNAFFDRLIPLGGVPSLVLGRTAAGVTFGGYTAYGFLARDDYREATTARSMFVFRLDDDGQVLVTDSTDPVQYDFFDYAVRLGAAMLGIPMNPMKHTMKSDVGTSSCRLPNGQTSLFGDTTLAKIEVLQVWVAKRYSDEVKAKEEKASKGFFSKLFG